jgi:hypothetical protein
VVRASSQVKDYDPLLWKMERSGSYLLTCEDVVRANAKRSEILN